MHVVLFLIDTLRADRLGPYGYERRETSPTMDWLAQHGVVFEQASAPAPWTLPSVASMFTSTLPVEHNVLGRHDKLSSSYETLAERLARCGYRNYSLTGNHFLAEGFGLDQGFDKLRLKGRNGGMEISTMLGPHPPEPSFVYVHNMEPHDPFHFAPPHTDGFADVGNDLRREMKRHAHSFKAAAEFDYREGFPLGTHDKTETQELHLAGLRALRTEWSELYDASIRLADSRIASTIKTLEARGYWANTLFIVVSDHGEEIGDRDGWLHDQSVYEELMRVPLIVRFPNDEHAGQRIQSPVSLIDLMPTILDYIGSAELGAEGHGKSLMPLVRGEATERQSGPFIPGMRMNVTRHYRPWIEGDRGNINVVVRDEHWKGIWNTDSGTFELYDLQTDPQETQNVASAPPDAFRAVDGLRQAVLPCNEGRIDRAGESKQTVERDPGRPPFPRIYQLVPSARGPSILPSKEEATE